MYFLNKALGVLVITDSLVLISGAMVIPFYAIFVEKIGGDILDAGIAASLFAITAGFSTLLAGKLSDDVKNKKTIVGISYLITALGFVLYLVVDSVLQLFAVQILIGLAQASYAPAFDALYTKHIGNKKYASSRWSVWEAANYFSIAIGALLGGLIINFAGFDALFLTMAGLCLLSGLYITLLPRKIL